MKTLSSSRAAYVSWPAIMLAIGISGCAARSDAPVAPDLGIIGPPLSVQLAPTHDGTLVVYTDWIPVPAIDLDTHQRSDYRILRMDGTVYRRVSNAGHAAAVVLPAGTYLVDTLVEPYGPMKIPVRVAADHQTEICLTGDWDAAFERVPKDAVVRLPDGRVIGWRAQPAVGVTLPAPSP